VDPWKTADIDMSSALRLVLNDCMKLRVAPQQLLAAPALWASLDYQTITRADIEGTLEFSVERNGTGHGIIIWFDACLVDGVGFSNAPEKPEAIYGSMFFPWIEPVPLFEGQQVKIDIQARLVKNDYIWSWNTRVGEFESRAEQTFQQSQLKAAIISKQKLEKSASDYIPQLSDDGVVNCRTLELMNGQNSLEQISKQLLQEFPSRFSRWQQALSWITQLSDKNY
jgi:protein arginine N-methyltransferase 1